MSDDTLNEEFEPGGRNDPFGGAAQFLSECQRGQRNWQPAFPLDWAMRMSQPPAQQPRPPKQNEYDIERDLMLHYRRGPTHHAF